MSEGNWVDSSAVTSDGMCARCGLAVERQECEVVDEAWSASTGKLAFREYLTTNIPCGDAKHSADYATAVQ